MFRRRTAQLGLACSLLTVVACDDVSDPTAPRDRLLRPGPPLHAVVDPDAEVTPTISVSPVACGATGTVTVSIAGRRPPPRDIPLDLLLVLDESGSISSSQWQQIRQASIDLVHRLDAADGAADGILANIRIGVIKFATGAAIAQPLGTTDRADAWAGFFANMTQLQGSTNIVGALNLARTHLMSQGAPTAAKAVVFMTDGQATAGDQTDAGQLNAASAVKALPARLFIVGVGTNIDEPLLQRMASADSYVPIANFDALGGAFDDVANQALVFPAAMNLVLAASLGEHFTLVPGSVSASKGAVEEALPTLRWDVGELLDETVTLTYEIQHNASSAPQGGQLTAVSNAQFSLVTPISRQVFSEAVPDVTVDILCDVTPPVITPQVVGTAGDNGWYRSDVEVSWSVVDDESAIASRSGCDAVSLTSDAPEQSLTCSATSAGGTASATVVVKRDATAPVVSYAGAAASYDVSENVAITCSASDNLSGVASSTCSDIAGPAWKFPLGANTFSAQATDNAGNVGSGSTTFEITVSYAGLCRLVEQFVEHHGIANSLCTKLSHAADAHPPARDGHLRAFINEVEGLSGKRLAADKAALLIALAKALM